MNAATLLPVLLAEKELERECQGRAVRTVKPQVIEQTGLAELKTKMFREGTIVCFVAHVQTELMGQLLTAIKGGKPEEIDALGVRLKKMETDGIARASGGSVVDAPHLVDVRYGSVALGRGLAPSFTSISVTEAVWNGGTIDPAKFAAADYVRDNDLPPIQVVIVLVKPRLSALEEAVLRSVPKDIDEVHVKGPSLSWTPVVQQGLYQPLGGLGTPFLQQDVRQHTQQQVQQQQTDKQVQQQQQQQQQVDKQAQQQQQQQQDRNQTQQQQQQQNQDQNQTYQQQQQQQQDAQTNQQQQQNEQDAQTNQEQEQQQGDRAAWLDDREGLMLGAFGRDDYLEQLKATDFSGLDATQSAQVLLRLREQFLRYGLS